MDPKAQAAADLVNEDFEPFFDWARDEESDTLILMLQGFKRENLRIQISPNRKLKVRGEQQISEKRWRRFSKEFTLPSYYDTNGIGAKLEDGVLYVRLPKVITAVQPATTPTPQAPPPPTQRVPTQGTPQEEQKEKELSQRKPQKEKEPTDEGKEDNGKRTEAEGSSTSEAHAMHEARGGLGEQGEAKIDEKRSPLPTMDLVSGQARESRDAPFGGIKLGKQKEKVVNLLVLVFLVLVLGLYVKNAIKSSFGGSRIQEL